MKRYAADFLLLIVLLLIDITPLSARMWTADLHVTVLSTKVQKIELRGKFYQNDLRVRFEPSGSEEIVLFDFERSVGTRIFPSDRIYFEKPLTRARILKAMKEGWIIPAPPYREERVFLREGRVKARKARLYLIIIVTNKKKDYSLRWESDDEEAVPIKIIYPSSGRETIIVEYNHIELKPINDEIFQPPKDFMNLNPF
ncbi:MAG: hypothetical protein ABGX83_07880 [Nitrospira sp.]|nr:hypothetical protein [Candidatus Manganitrophaceae bacterium]HIL34113.1 hypothetical protein [Candidatus Manganitrophaceae bacterium]